LQVSFVFLIYCCQGFLQLLFQDLVASSCAAHRALTRRDRLPVGLSEAVFEESSNDRTVLKQWLKLKITAFKKNFELTAVA
jgi:hypothetical protein